MVDLRYLLADYERREDAIKVSIHRNKNGLRVIESFEKDLAPEREMLAKRKAIIKSWIEEDLEAEYSRP